jgi:hypothetical protein
VFPSPHIVVGFSVPLLCVLCFTLGRLTAPRRRTRGLYLRPSFWLKPVASPPPNRTTMCTSDLTPTRVGSFSSSLPLGEVSEVWAIPRRHHEPSRLTERGWSTAGTATHGASGAPRGDAA